MNAIANYSFRLAATLLLSAGLFALLPFVHSLFGGPAVVEPPSSIAPTILMEAHLDKKTPVRHPIRPPRRVQDGSRTGPTGRSLDLQFSPDLSVGSGAGVDVQEQNLQNIVYGQSQVDEPARVRYRTSIPFPPTAVEMGISGTASFVIVVDRSGRVADVQFQSVPHSMFKKPIEKAVRKWKFDPARIDGVPVSQNVHLEIEFNLNE